MNTKCPCGYEKRDYKNCCEPYILGVLEAPTAEALMRSRYSAFFFGKKDHLLNTAAGPALATVDEQQLDQTFLSTRFTKLEILSSNEATALATVHFSAHYIEGGKAGIMVEKSVFKKINGAWFYWNNNTE